MKSVALRLILTVISITILGCNVPNDQWITLDLGFFSIRTPKGWTAYRKQGIDTYPGGITNQRDTLGFDYGAFAGEINEEDADQHLYGQAIINGHTAIIQLPRTEGQGSLRISIPHASEENRFNIGGYDVHDTPTILEMFKTIRFKDSDTTRNMLWTKDMFRQYPFGSGRTLYIHYCTSCHMEFREITGPSIKDILESRSNDWIVQFLYNGKMLLPDSLTQARIANAGDTCMKFSELTRKDAEQIAAYLREN